MTTLGQTIRLRRDELGLTQEKLAERVGNGVRQAEISRLENDGVALPRRQRLEQLALALEMPMGVLLARSGWTGADEEFPNGSIADTELEEGIAILQFDAESTDGENLVGPNPAMPRLHDAITRAEQMIHDSEAAIERSQTTYSQVEKMLLEQRRQRAGQATPTEG
jgi:transcriptional regulator with XRE-family HTH domain